MQIDDMMASFTVFSPVFSLRADLMGPPTASQFALKPADVFLPPQSALGDNVKQFHCLLMDVTCE